VDDDPDTAQSFALLLRSLGHHADFVSDARAVMGTVRRERPDAVFLDIGMPHLDGFELARIVKRESRETYVVAITRHGSDEYRKRGREAGFDAYVTKPVDLPMLQSILDTLSRRAPRASDHRSRAHDYILG
jgi:two-component system CheB/CheR fusion protein